MNHTIWSFYLCCRCIAIPAKLRRNLAGKQNEAISKCAEIFGGFTNSTQTVIKIAMCLTTVASTFNYYTCSSFSTILVHVSKFFTDAINYFLDTLSCVNIKMVLYNLLGRIGKVVEIDTASPKSRGNEDWQMRKKEFILKTEPCHLWVISESQPSIVTFVKLKMVEK